ncbi:hypothetical protein RJ641_017816, partial [Dillenia turbinata]
VNSVAVNSKYCNVAFVAIAAPMVGSIPFSKNERDYAQKGDEVTIHIFKIVVVMVQVNGSDG